jgi:hypothetical protein
MPLHPLLALLLLAAPLPSLGTWDSPRLLGPEEEDYEDEDDEEEYPEYPEYSYPEWEEELVEIDTQGALYNAISTGGSSVIGTGGVLDVDPGTYEAPDSASAYSSTTVYSTANTYFFMRCTTGDMGCVLSGGKERLIMSIGDTMDDTVEVRSTLPITRTAPTSTLTLRPLSALRSLRSLAGLGDELPGRQGKRRPPRCAGGAVGGGH